MHLSDPDTILMLEFQKGDVASFETLMHKYYARILNFLYRFVANREAAEDLTQEVFIRVYKSAATYRPEAQLKTWIYTIAKNIALNELRKGHRHFVSLDEVLPSEEGSFKHQIEDRKAIHPRRELEKQERARAVKRAIDELPENQQLAVVLRRYEDLSHEEIAETMACSVSAVKSLLTRAKLNLKVKLEEYLKND
ncbi:MAG: sigma-70 family RNA polymerase sigma factor [Candidatus Omnitrophica bacterium]|nr:sigma-70 family RNA polymerase sigma factor [Candidatus Omnitrophota bacterium]